VEIDLSEMQVCPTSITIDYEIHFFLKSRVTHMPIWASCTKMCTVILFRHPEPNFHPNGFAESMMSGHRFCNPHFPAIRFQKSGHVPFRHKQILKFHVHEIRCVRSPPKQTRKSKCSGNLVSFFFEHRLWISFLLKSGHSHFIYNRFWISPFLERGHQDLSPPFSLKFVLFCDVVCRKSCPRAVARAVQYAWQVHSLVCPDSGQVLSLFSPIVSFHQLFSVSRPAAKTCRFLGFLDNLDIFYLNFFSYVVTGSGCKSSSECVC